MTTNSIESAAREYIVADLTTQIFLCGVALLKKLVDNLRETCSPDSDEVRRVDRSKGRRTYGFAAQTRAVSAGPAFDQAGIRLPRRTCRAVPAL